MEWRLSNFEVIAPAPVTGLINHIPSDSGADSLPYTLETGAINQALGILPGIGDSIFREDTLP